MLDISRALAPGMAVYAPEEGFFRDQTMLIARDGCNLSYLHMGAHCGTHLDAPAHFVEGGRTVDQVPLALLVGPAWVIGADQLNRAPRCERLLIKNAPGFTGLTVAQAQALADSGVRLLGTELLSVAQGENTSPVHKLLLGRGVWLLETLNLEHVPPGPYTLYCLPLKVAGGEGAPARAILEAL